MRCARAEPLRAALVWVICAALLVGCSRGTEIDPSTPSASSASPDASLGEASEQVADRALVAELGSALRRSAERADAAALVALAAPGAQELLAAVGDNVRALRVADVETRYLDADTPLGPEERRLYGAGARAVRMELRYAYEGLDRRVARVEARAVLLEADGEGGIVAFGGGSGTRTPLWLVEPLTVVRSGADLVAVAGDAGRYPRLVARAREQVRQTLPRWSGPLVVEVPRDADQLEGALAAPSGEYDAIAGLAAAVDTAPGRGAPVRVYVNPEVFDELSERGAQVVMTHEATHVAVDAPSARMPVWLLEGFADYVALAAERVPVQVAARQVLEQVRASGPPDDLPSSADLAPTALDLGATYEEAWLACRYLAQTYGAAAMVRFYDRVDAGDRLDDAFVEVLGTSLRDFVRGWSADVARLAERAG